MSIDKNQIAEIGVSPRFSLPQEATGADSRRGSILYGIMGVLAEMEKPLTELRRFILWVILALIVVLTILSVYGAFLGADRAKNLFNSAPLAVYWVMLFVIFLEGFILFKRLLRAPGILLIHLGCVAILIGGMWGSAAGRQLQKKWFHRDIIPTGKMYILEGQKEQHVYVADGHEVRELPFEILLDRFITEYYPARLHVSTIQGGREWAFRVEPNALYDLGEEYGTIKIVRLFENFKINLEGDRQPYDAPGSGTNPAVELQEISPDNKTTRRFVFAQQRGHTSQNSPLAMEYSRVVSDWISELKVLDEGEVVAEKAVEVNHPLYYDGYHFYQGSYGQDPQSGKMYTGLSVVNNTGIRSVYVGYILLCAGTIWQLWFIRPRRYQKLEVR